MTLRLTREEASWLRAILLEYRREAAHDVALPYPPDTQARARVARDAATALLQILDDALKGEGK